MSEVCVVTGVAGFIGSHLAERLLEKGFQVRGIDCFTDYYPRFLKEGNLDRVRKKEGFAFIEDDLSTYPLDTLLSGATYIFHSAAQAGVRSSWGEHFNIYTKNNVLATQQLLEAARKQKIKKLIYASSSSVYGDCREYPLREMSLPQPVSPYGVSKLAAEQLCYLYWKNFRVPVVSLRYFTVYGPGQRPDMAFNRFICAVLAQKEITLYGSGEQTRDFTFIQDIVDANLQAMQASTEGKAYNIGGGSRVTINQCIEIIEELSGLDAKIKREGFCKGDMEHTWADIEQAQKDLAYSPKTSLREGLKKELDWLSSIERSWQWV